MNNKCFLISFKDKKINGYRAPLLLEAIYPYKDIYQVAYMIDEEEHEGGMIEIGDDDVLDNMINFFNIKKEMVDCYILDDSCHYLNDDVELKEFHVVNKKRKGHTMLIALGMVRDNYPELKDVFAGKISISYK